MFDREVLGKLVRETWMKWAEKQPHPKPSWLVQWDGLSEPYREVDRQIGEVVAQYILARAAEEQALIRDYYTAAQMSKHMSTEYEVRNHADLMDALMLRTTKILNLEPDEEIECECGNTLAWLIGFFGHNYQNSHINDCPDCGQHTLHVSDESGRCLKCKSSSGIDAEGNHIVCGQIVSNGGKSIDQLRDEYFAGEV